jgi:hypothetical protein
MGFIGFGIYFCLEKSIDRVYASYAPAMGGRQELNGVERASAPGRRGLLRKLGEGDGESVELTEVGVGWRGGGVMPATERICGSCRSSMGARPSE